MSANEPRCKSCGKTGIHWCHDVVNCKKTVILVNGLKRAGKDYTSDLLVAALNNCSMSAKSFSFAAPMKCIISKTFNITLAQLDDYKNDSERYHLCPIDMKDGNHGDHTNFRTILQRFGTEAMKPIFGDTIWTELVCKNIRKSKEDFIIISDFRFTEEYDYMVKQQEFNVITVNVQGQSQEDPNAHASERKPTCHFDHVIDNSKQDGTVAKWVSNFIKEL